jgi:hypothetical protein
MTDSQITKLVSEFKKQRTADHRYASFDYCFNYFRRFRGGRLNELAAKENIENSCLHLGFYLASWGMFRMSGKLGQQCNLRHFQDVVEEISLWDSEHELGAVWEMDAGDYGIKFRRSGFSPSLARWRVKPALHAAMTLRDGWGLSFSLGPQPAWVGRKKPGEPLSPGHAVWRATERLRRTPAELYPPDGEAILSRSQAPKQRLSPHATMRQIRPGGFSAPCWLRKRRKTQMTNRRRSRPDSSPPRQSARKAVGRTKRQFNRPRAEYRQRRPKVLRVPVKPVCQSTYTVTPIDEYS